MQPKQVILLVILGALLAIAGIVSLQYMLVLIVLAFIVVVLLISDLKHWVESLVEKIAAGHRSDPSEITRMSESITSMETGISRIEQRLDALEKKEKD